MGTMQNKVISILIVLLIVLSVITLTYSYIYEEAYDGKSPIIINGNEEFTLKNGVKRGSGTATDPYIIEGWNIKGSSNHGIYIGNTTAYFVIRNCIISNSNEVGIYFYNVSNGNIEKCEIKNSYGIYNTISSTGIYVNIGSKINITNSFIYNNNGTGIILRGTSEIFIENTSVYYNSDGVNIIGSGLGYYGNNNIKNSNISNNNIGIIMLLNPWSVIENCEILSNNVYGIWLGMDSSGLEITNNDIEKNGKGINIEFIGASYEGDVNIYNNNFIENNIQAIDNGTNNTWDYNYWDDWSGSGSYDIEGSAGAKDEDPLKYPFP